MREQIDELLTRYEMGQINRRQLLGALATLFVLTRRSSAAEPAIGNVRQLNHVTIFVENVQKSVDFYQRLFGMPVLTPQPPGINLKAGTSFLGIYPAQGRPTGIDHFCLALDGFNADDTLEKLSSHGLTGSIRRRGDTKELMFTDPDNIRVQLQDVSYTGGVGPLGNRHPN
jgi:catechol 2,3-dioxygenase-like lactoylglutathione lyase family enzyme